ncbi:MAG: hypothetical protein IKX59_11735 [Bacteroidales bacterium]|nr:hypothetical protein [Bacteroidales bacterium]
MEQPKQDCEEMRISSEQIKWSKEDPSKLDLKYHGRLGILRKVVLVGAVLTLVISLSSMAAHIITLHGDILFLTYLPFLFNGIIGVMGGLGIAKRKPNAIYLCKVFAWTCTVYYFFNLVFSIATGSFPSLFGILWLFYGLYLLYYLYTSKDVKLIFPKEYRRVRPFDIILTVVNICLFVFTTLYFIYGLIVMASEA